MWFLGVKNKIKLGVCVALVIMENKEDNHSGKHREHCMSKGIA
jgi:hypothetical protein